MKYVECRNRHDFSCVVFYYRAVHALTNAWDGARGSSSWTTRATEAATTATVEIQSCQRDHDISNSMESESNSVLNATVAIITTCSNAWHFASSWVSYFYRVRWTVCGPYGYPLPQGLRCCYTSLTIFFCKHLERCSVSKIIAEIEEIAMYRAAAI